jgi:PAS domain S-box-containing protein
MMFGAASIKRKLILINLVTLGVALLVIGSALIYEHAVTARQSLVDNLNVQARVIAAGSSAPLAFDDSKAAQEILAAFKAVPNIRRAVIYDRKGNKFAEYWRQGETGGAAPLSMGREGRFLKADRIGVIQAVDLQGERLGSVFVESDVSQLRADIIREMGVVVAVLSAVFAVVLLLLSKAQQTITGPLLELARLMRLVSEKRAYSLRTDISSRNEIGTLARGFNDMLEQIQKRDEELEQHRLHLEHLVGQRTAELQHELAERQRAEETVERLRRDMEMILESAGEGILTMDLNGNQILVNPAAARMLGYEVKEMIGRESHGLWHYARADNSPYPLQECPVHDTLQDGTARRIDSEVFWRRDGTSFPVEYVSTPIHRDGKVTGAVIVFRDITDRKRVEQEMDHYAAELKRSNEQLQQFAYIASHDLQEPLRMIASYLQLIERRYKGKLDKDVDEFIGFAVDGAGRLQNMVGGLLEFSRVETRGKPFEAVDCEAVLEKSLDNLKLAVTESGAQITHDPLPTVMADMSQLIQLFQNLIGNAIKFRKKEEAAQIHISAERREKEWLFAFRDNGIGMEPQYKDRIFGIFQRLHGRDEYPGTGIGLAVCKRIVERHGGHIWVESEPGKGATFYFTIPVTANGRSPVEGVPHAIDKRT